MPKGRGSNERRRTPRQKTAVRIARLSKSDPRAVFHDVMKVRRMWGKRNPLNFTVALDREPHTWKLTDHPRTEKAKRKTEKNKWRRGRNWKGN